MKPGVKKVLLVVGILVGLPILISVVYSAYLAIADPGELERIQREAEAERRTKDSIESVEASTREIKLPGLMPVDVYLSMEKKGFTVEKRQTEFGNTWECKSGDNSVTVFSKSAMDVETVSATALMLDNPRIALPFIKFVASAPIDGVDREAVQNWIESHFDDDGATFESGDVRYKIGAPTKFARVLLITHKNAQG